MSNINVQIDDRARLVTAVLSVSEWSGEEQKQLTHAVHPHAKQTRKFLHDYRFHQAVLGANQAMLNGVTLEELFSTAVRCQWPIFEPTEPLPHLLKIERWARSLADFEYATEIDETFWQQHSAVWQTAVDALVQIFQDGKVAAFLGKLTRNPDLRQIALMPNLVYPALRPVLATSQATFYLLLPPPKAVGESPPWPYDEDPPWVVATVCQKLATRLLADQLAPLDKTQRSLYRHAVVTLCLEDAFDEFEGQAYLLRAKKEHALPDLPQVVNQLRRYLDGELAVLADIFN
ncbi:MAG: hypothetical protein GY796_32410 [Chloroflexi bacterium]|nr:hypothetical protein [Chloroflexota bacterium]